MNRIYYRILFLYSVVLCSSNLLIAQPDFSFPWPVGEARWLHWGAHANNCTGLCGTCSGDDESWSSLDFGHFEDGSAEVRPAAEGKIEFIDGSQNIVVIKHEEGGELWFTGYYHLIDVPIYLKKGDAVDRGTFIGNGSSESNGGGGAEQPHVHFSIRKRTINNHIDIKGMYIGGYKVEDHTCHRYGRLSRKAKNRNQTLHTFEIIPEGNESPYGLGDVPVRAVIMNDGVEGRYRLHENLPIHGLSNPDVTVSFVSPVVASEHISIQPPFKISSLTSFILDAAINPIDDNYESENHNVKLRSPTHKEGKLNDTKKERGSIAIYPNPTLNKINIQIDRDLEIFQFNIYSIDGRLMVTIDNESTSNHVKEIDISVSNLKSGIYVVKAIGADRSYNSTFLKL